MCTHLGEGSITKWVKERPWHKEGRYLIALPMG